MNRLKNYGLWISIAAFIPMFLKGIGHDVIPANYNELVSSLLSILVVAGIINNPQTENKGFLDDNKDDNKVETNKDAQ